MGYGPGMTFTARIPARFGHSDPAGIVYYPRYLHYCHCAFEDFFADAGKPYFDVLMNEGLGWPTVHLETTFQQPLRFGQELSIDVSVTKIGNSSATFRYRGYREGESEDVMRAEITVVCVSFTDLKPRPIPPAYRELFMAHLVPNDGSSEAPEQK